MTRLLSLTWRLAPKAFRRRLVRGLVDRWCTLFTEEERGRMIEVFRAEIDRQALGFARMAEAEAKCRDLLGEDPKYAWLYREVFGAGTGREMRN